MDLLDALSRKEGFMKNALFQNKRQYAPVSFVTGLFLLLTVLVNPLIVHADSVEPKYLPYDYSWNYYALSDGQINTMLNMASSYIDISSDNLIIFWYEIGNNTWLYEFCVAIVDDVQYPNGKNYDSVNLTAESVTLHFSSSYIGFTDFNNIHDPGNQNYSPSSFNFFGSNSQLVETSNIISYKGMPLYGTVELNNKIIIGVPQGQDVGSAVAPSFGAGAGVGGSDFLGSGADFGASLSQATMPSAPTYNTYNFTTFNPPSFDDSSVLDALQSIADILLYLASYLSQNISGAINNLGDNIQALGEYIGDLLQYIARSIITNIQNGIQNLYDNIDSFFEPVFNFISEVLSGIKTIVDHIISLGLDDNGNFSLTTLFVNLAIPSESDLQDAVSDSDTFGLINVASSVNSKILSEVTTLKGLSSSKIIHVPSCYFHGLQIGDYDIDFSWYDNYKTLGDGIISAFLIWNYIWFLFFRLPSYIRGQGGAFVSDVNSSIDYSNQYKNS